MHSRRSPASISSGFPADILDLGLSGTRLTVSQRPSSASPGKCFSRSVSVACDGRARHNTLGDVGFGSSRSIKNLRRSNSTTQVNQQANLSTRDQDCLALLGRRSEGRQKLLGLSKTAPDRTTWNVLDEQPRAVPLHSPSCSLAEGGAGQRRRREPRLGVAASFTANNRSNKGAVGNSVTTILHNNYSEKPLTPKSSNQKPSFNNILKATANDEVSPDSGSLTKSQKNFSASSNLRSLLSAHRGRRAEVTEEEAERFVEQVNQAAITIQRWYRRHTQHTSQDEVIQHAPPHRSQEWEEPPGEARPDQPHRKHQDRRLIREEKARRARLAAVQELHHTRAQRAAEEQLESLRPSSVGGRKKPPRLSPINKGPASPSSNSPVSLTDIKTKNTDSVNVLCDFAGRSFRAISPAQCSQEEEGDGVERPQHQDSLMKLIRKERARLAHLAAIQTNPAQQDAEEAEGANPLPAVTVGRKKPLKIIVSNQSPASPSHKRPTSPTDVKTKNTDSNLCVTPDLAELGFRAVSPASSNQRSSQCSQEILQRSVSVEDQRQGASSKGTLHELLDNLKLLEEEPERLSEEKSYRQEKYAWIDEDADSNSLTTDNLERHGQLSHHPVLPDGGALLSEAKLQSIMSFLDEMEKSEQERPRSVTSGSHREAMLSEEEVAAGEHRSAAMMSSREQASAAMMSVQVELEEKRRTVSMLQATLAQQRELTVRQVKETERELSRGAQLQKEQYEATIQRHLTFIDQLISDKKALSERCEGVLGELQQVDHKYMKKMAQMQEQHEMVWQILGPLCQEIKQLKDLMSATGKIRREKWIEEKTRKIKEITVKGLEPEIQKLISKHKQELKQLRALHQAELLQAEERAAQRFSHQQEALRQQLERDKEEQCQRERELAQQRYEKQLQQEELSLQEQRRRLYQDVSEEKDRLAQLAARQRAELEDLRQQLELSSSLAGRALRNELDRSREEQDRRHQEEMKALQERMHIEKQTWEENYKKKEEAWLLSRQQELKDQLMRKRDKEIELAIWALEEEASKDKEENRRAADSRMKRMRERYEAELMELKHSERTAMENHQEMRRQQMQTEGELVRLQAALRQKEQEMEDIAQARDKLAEERRGLAEVIRQEFAERLVTTEEENRRLKVEMSEMRARLVLEAERLTREKEEELAQVHQRVKSAILKKEEIVSTLQKQHQAAVKRADHLEALWEQQKKQLLEK